MAGRASVNTSIDNAIKANGNGEITGALLNTILKLITQHFMNLSDDTAAFRNFGYNSSGSVSYQPNYLAVQNGELYICTTPTSGAFNPAHWIKASQAAVVFSYPAWNSLEPYSFDEGTREGFKIYRSIIPGIDTNTGNLPSASPLAWQEISPSEGGNTSVPEWVAGAYKAKQQVIGFIDGQPYYFYADSQFNSVNFSDEFINGKWKVIGNVIDDNNLDVYKLWSSDKINTELNALATAFSSIIATKANDADVVKLTGNQTVAGVKTFSGAPVSSTAAANNNELMRKGEVDTALATKAALTQSDFISITVEFPENGTYLLVVNTPYAFTIHSITTKAESGTCTATFNINGVALGGSANAVSTSEVTQSHTTSNALAVGDDLNLVISSNASTRKLSVTIRITRTLANA